MGKLLVLGLLAIGICGIADSIEYISADVSHILFKDEISERCEGVKLNIQKVLPPEQLETASREIHLLFVFCIKLRRLVRHLILVSV
jgi:hypothetical protein